MKELSIEEKAKRYDEILARATGAYLPYYTEDIMTKVREFVDYLLPELKKESEDERIRKELLNAFQEAEDSLYMVLTPNRRKSFIAWLEKQGEHANFRNKIQIGDKVTRNEDGVLVNLSQLNRVAKKDEKQGKQKPAPDWMPKFLDELRSKKNYFDWEEHKDIEGGILAIINWMNPNYFNEKDGKQKADKVEAKFKVGDKIYLKPEYRMPDDDTPIANTVFEIRAIDDKHYKFDRSYIFIEDQDKYELVEQKPVDKKEPKKIEKMPTEWSEDDQSNFNELSSFILETYRAEDASRLLIWFNDIKDRVMPQPKQEWSEEDECCRNQLITFCENCMVQDSNAKKCADWLKSLKDRYTWKPSGEQKPLFPDNEVRDIWEYLYKFKTLYGHYPNDADEIEVIVREVIKSKAEWNKRDEEILDTIISVFTHRYADDSEDERDISSWEIVRWAEKLKSRKLKSEWKPSNEQMAVLNEVINYAANSELQHWSSFIYTLLKSLREQLKKLREE